MVYFFVGKYAGICPAVILVFTVLDDQGISQYLSGQFYQSSHDGGVWKISGRAAMNSWEGRWSSTALHSTVRVEILCVSMSPGKLLEWDRGISIVSSSVHVRRVPMWTLA